MSIERRLKKTHSTVIQALHQTGQELQRQLFELDTAIKGQLTEWAALYGLSPDRQYVVEGRPDGKFYLVAVSKPAEGEGNDDSV
jgi:hypothetical protein